MKVVGAYAYEFILGAPEYEKLSRSCWPSLCVDQCGDWMPLLNRPGGVFTNAGPVGGGGRGGVPLPS